MIKALKSDIKQPFIGIFILKKTQKTLDFTTLKQEIKFLLKKADIL